jgi:hypothetical protein
MYPPRQVVITNSFISQTDAAKGLGAKGSGAFQDLQAAATRALINGTL